MLSQLRANYDVIVNIFERTIIVLFRTLVNNESQFYNT